MVQPKAHQNKDGSTSWRVQYRVNGKLTGTRFTNYKGALGFADLVNTVGGTQARAVLDARREHTTTPTLREWTAQYVDASSGILTGIEAGTREGYLREAERTFLPVLGDYPVDAITEQAIGKWLAWQEKQTVHRDRNKPIAEREFVSSKTIKNAHSLLSGVLAAAVKQKLATENPAYGMRLPKGVRRDAVFLSPAEFETLLHFTRPQHRGLLLFLAGSGTRWGEATALTWSDLTRHVEVPTVRITKAWKRGATGEAAPLRHPKTSRSLRTVSLTHEIVQALGPVGEPDALIFASENGTRVKHSNFTTRVWNPAVARATNAEHCAEIGGTRLPRAPHIHDLRHTHASWLIARGVPLTYIQARLGHESITTTSDTYGHLQPDAHEQMARMISDTLSGISVNGLAPLAELAP